MADRLPTVGEPGARARGDSAAGASAPGDSGAGASEPTGGGSNWDDLAGWWRRTFTNGADVEYERQILPLATEQLAGCSRLLDVGTGEGQLSRRLVAADPAPRLVVGIDPSARQLANAAEQTGVVRYVRAAGERLPFADGAFDGVACCLVIEHASDPDAVLGELARVLGVSGRLVLLVNHPVVQGPGSGFVDDRILGERYWRIGPYLTETATVEEVDPGVPVRFAHRPLSRYVNPLVEHGLVLTRLEEPAPPLEFLADSVDVGLELSMPRLCLMRFERR